MTASNTSADSPPEVAASAVTPQPSAPGRNYGELALSVLLVLLGIYVVVDAGSIAIPGSSNTVGPRFFPYLVGGATIVVGVALGIRILRGDQGPPEEGEDIDPNATTSWRAVGIISR
jgi:putative tricarboxylic transport membrane protein